MENNYKDMSLAQLRELLTEKQLCFAEALAEGLEPRDAAMRAGYSEKIAPAQGAKMANNPRVAAYRRALSAEKNGKEGLSPDWVRRKLAEVAERCMEATPHMVYDRESKSYVHDGTWEFDAEGAIKALSAMGKIGSFSEDAAKNGEGEGLEAFLARLEGGRSF